MRKLALFAATGAGSGYPPVAPGTAGVGGGARAPTRGLLAVLGSAALGYLAAAAAPGGS